MQLISISQESGMLRLRAPDNPLGGSNTTTMLEMWEMSGTKQLLLTNGGPSREQWTWTKTVRTFSVCGQKVLEVSRTT